MAELPKLEEQLRRAQSPGEQPAAVTPPVTPMLSFGTPRPYQPYDLAEQFARSQDQTTPVSSQSGADYEKLLKSFGELQMAPMRDVMTASAERYGTQAKQAIPDVLKGLGIQPGVAYGDLTMKYIVNPALTQAMAATKTATGMTPGSILGSSYETQSPLSQALQSSFAQALQERYARLSTEQTPEGAVKYPNLPKPPSTLPQYSGKPLLTPEQLQARKVPGASAASGLEVYSKAMKAVQEQEKLRKLELPVSE